MLTKADINPGDAISYDLCKQIYAFHPLGKKMADGPVALAQSQQREISIGKGPEDRVKEQFLLTWARFNCDNHIFNVTRLARIYGASALGCLVEGEKPDSPIDLETLWKKNIAFNVWDSLNTAGSMVLDQNPNNMTFQKVVAIAVNGQTYHGSRVVAMLNEDPLYIEYTTSAFGFSGRSVYQRALFPLKSFINTMIADDMVARKVGVLVAKLKSAGSIISDLMLKAAGFKRNIVKEAETNNVISIGETDEVSSLDMQGIAGALEPSRKNILENIAVSADMPAKLLNSETFAEGFGEGTEDAKAVAKYIDGVRAQMKAGYDFFDTICMYVGWNPEFYEIIQKEFPEEYGGVPFKTAFYQWKNSFKTQWPNLLTEPDSEKIRVDDVKLRAVIAYAEVLLPLADPENKAIIYAWMQDAANDLKLLFGSKLVLDTQAMSEYEPPKPETGAGDGKPSVKGSFADSQPRRDKTRAQLELALDAYMAASGPKLKGPDIAIPAGSA